MSWPAANVGFSEFGLSALASHTFTQEFFTAGGAAPSFAIVTVERPTRDTAGPWKADEAKRKAIIAEEGVSQAWCLAPRWRCPVITL